MVITRTVDGTDYDFTLSESELIRAFEEQQRINDERDIESLVDYTGEPTVQFVYGITKERFYELIPAMAEKLRDNLDHLMPFKQAREKAVDDVIYNVCYSEVQIGISEEVINVDGD